MEVSPIFAAPKSKDLATPLRKMGEREQLGSRTGRMAGSRLKSVLFAGAKSVTDEGPSTPLNQVIFESEAFLSPSLRMTEQEA